MSAKNWCITLNNYDENDYIILWTFIKNECNYGIIGKEIGELNTPHLQGYFQCKKRITLKWLKKINNKCHFEIAKGDAAQNK